jgi:class 3 adenylate cyclase
MLSGPFAPLMEITQAVKRASATEALSVRIGIATGPVVVGQTAGILLGAKALLEELA